MSQSEEIQHKVRRYYSRKLREHGPTAAGVDWNSEESQRRRFVELCMMIEPHHSVLDIGCGYGAMLTHLRSTGWRGEYFGYDICPEMIAAAQEMHSGRERFTSTLSEVPDADMVVASGVFNVKLDVPTQTWQRYVDEALHLMYKHCRIAFGFNVLTAYSDQDRMREDLYYASASRYLDYCAKHFSRWMTLKHDYGLFEFTLLVRR